VKANDNKITFCNLPYHPDIFSDIWGWVIMMEPERRWTILEQDEVKGNFDGSL